MYLSSINLRLGYLRHKTGRVKYTQKPLSVKTISLSALKRPFRVKTFGSTFSTFSWRTQTHRHTHTHRAMYNRTLTVALRITHLCEHVIIYHDLSAIYFNDI